MEIHRAQIGTEIGVSQHGCLASLSLLDMGGMFWGPNGDGDRDRGSSMELGLGRVRSGIREKNSHHHLRHGLG